MYVCAYMCVVARPAETARVSRDEAATRRRERQATETREPSTRRRAPSAPESYTAEEYKSWVSQRHQRSPSAPSRRRSVGPSAAERRRVAASTSRRPTDGEGRVAARSTAAPRPAAAASTRRPVAVDSSRRDATLTKKPLKIRTEVNMIQMQVSTLNLGY